MSAAAFGAGRRGQGCRALDHDRCVGTGFEQKGDFGSPFANPSTGEWRSPEPSQTARAGDGGGSVPITAMRARGKRADRGGMTALSMMHDGEDDTRSPDLLPAPA